MNLMMLLEMAAEGMPDRVAIGSHQGGLTYAELFARAGAAATRFQAAPGERVVLCDESSPAVPISIFGAAWAGLPYVPLNYRLPDGDLRALAERSSPAIAVADATGSERLATVDGVETVVRDDFVADPAGSRVGPHPGRLVDGCRGHRRPVVHQRHHRCTEVRRPPPPPPRLLHPELGRVHGGGRGRGHDRERAAVPRRRCGLDALVDLLRAPHRPAPEVRSRHLDRHRRTRERHPRHARAHDALAHRRRARGARR